MPIWITAILLALTAAQRRHTIEELDAGVRCVIRVRALDAADRPLGGLPPAAVR